MIYLVGMISGFANGFFTSGAGQILVFYLVFLKKIESHKARGTSILILSIASVVSLIYYLFKVKVDIFRSIVVILISLILGIIASKIMKKISSKVLNLISGILMTVLASINLIKG